MSDAPPATSFLNLFISLPITHPSISPLLTSHRPLAYPSHLPGQLLNRFLNRINSAILQKHVASEVERRAACQLGTILVEQDEEGYVMMQYGKGWVGTCLGVVTVKQLLDSCDFSELTTIGQSLTSPLSTIEPYLNLLSSIVFTSPHYPSFERETVHPMLGKLSVSLVKLLERSLPELRPDWTVVYLHLLEITSHVVMHSPATFRPLVSSLRQLLLSIILRLPRQIAGASSSTSSLNSRTPHQVREAVARLVATLHLASGKAQSPAVWASDLKMALGGLGTVMNAITADAWVEDPGRVQPPSPSDDTPPPPADANTRLPMALDMLEGWVEIILALLRFRTSRPVPVPLNLIMAAGLRCLNLTLDTPIVDLISPQHHAALLAALPRLWTSGLLLIGGAASVCGDHLFPHLSSIFDHTVWLAERIPGGMSEPHIQLLRFHRLALNLYPPALLPIQYPTRLLRMCLGRLSPLLEARPVPSAELAAKSGGAGKRGKKRIRGAEDGLVGGLEGRENKAFSQADRDVVVEALKLTPLLHPTPLLQPELLTFSIRLHLSLHLSIPSLPALSGDDVLERGVAHVLGEALMIGESSSGTSPGWTSVILSVLDPRRPQASLLLHPSLPPLIRPQPPLSALHFFAPENQEEKRIRMEMGFTTLDENGTGETQETEIDDLDNVGEPVVRLHRPVPGSLHVTKEREEKVSHANLGKEEAVPKADTMPIMLESSPTQLKTAYHIPTALPSVSPSSVLPSSETTLAPATPGDDGRPTPFMSVLSQVTADKGKGKSVVGELRRREASDSPIPELDSGSSDFACDDDEEAEAV